MAREDYNDEDNEDSDQILAEKFGLCTFIQVYKRYRASLVEKKYGISVNFGSLPILYLFLNTLRQAYHVD